MHAIKITEKSPHLVDTGEASVSKVFAACFVLYEALTSGMCTSEAWARNFSKRMAKSCVPLEKIRLCLVYLDRYDVQEVVELMSTDEIQVVSTLKDNGARALQLLQGPCLDVNSQLEAIECSLKAVKVRRDKLSIVSDESTRTGSNVLVAEVDSYRKSEKCAKPGAGVGNSCTTGSTDLGEVQSLDRDKTAKLPRPISNSTFVNPSRPDGESESKPFVKGHDVMFSHSEEFDSLYSILAEYENRGREFENIGRLRSHNARLREFLFQEDALDDKAHLERLIGEPSSGDWNPTDLSHFDVFDVLEHSVLRDHAFAVLLGDPVSALDTRKKCDEISTCRDDWRNHRSSDMTLDFRLLLRVLPKSRRCSAAQVRSIVGRLYVLLSQKLRPLVRKMVANKAMLHQICPLLEQIWFCIRFLNCEAMQALSKNFRSEEVLWLNQLLSLGEKSVFLVSGTRDEVVKKAFDLNIFLRAVAQRKPLSMRRVAYAHPPSEQSKDDNGDARTTTLMKPLDDDMDISDDDGSASDLGDAELDDRELYNVGSSVSTAAVITTQDCDSSTSTPCHSEAKNSSPSQIRQTGEWWGFAVLF